MKLRESTLLLLIGASAWLARACSSEDTPAKTVVLISIDTLRRDRLGVYGNTPDVSPVIDAFARDAVVFDQALSVSSWTLPAHMSMLTGLDLVAHGVETPIDKLPDTIPTAAERLRSAGLRTAAFTAGGFVGPGWGFERGFELFDAGDGAPERLGFSRYLDAAVKWIESCGDAPLFLFAHSFDAHAPYAAGDPEILARFRARPVSDGDKDYALFRSSYTDYAKRLKLDRYGRMQELLNDYDAGVHEADRGVGRLLDTLRATGRYDDALIIVTSDHGESFYDHDLWVGHGLKLTEVNVGIPLLIKFPRGEGAGRRIDTLVDLVDLFPTLLDAAGVSIEQPVQGSSLREVMRGGERSRDYVLGGTYTTGRYFLVRDGYKFIERAEVVPRDVLRLHIGPSTPDCITAFRRESSEESDASGGQGLAEMYPVGFDPLGLMELLPFEPSLYERERDASELDNLAPDDVQRVAAMRKDLGLRVEISRRWNVRSSAAPTTRELNDDEVARIQALGYATGAEKSDPAETELVFEEIRNDPNRNTPNLDELIAIDRRVHRVRLKLRDHGGLDDADKRELTDCAEASAVWMETVRKPRFKMRALWRVLEIGELSKRAGSELDVQPFTERILAAHVERAPHDDEDDSTPKKH